MAATPDLDELYGASHRRLVVQLFAVCGVLADAGDRVLIPTYDGAVPPAAAQPVDDGGCAAPHSVDDQSAYWFLDADPFADDSMPQIRLNLATGEQAAVTPEEHPADVGARPARTLLTSHAESGFELYEITFVYEWNFEVRGGSVEPMGMQPLEVRDGLTGAKLAFDAPAGFSGGAWFSQWRDDDTIVLVSASKRGADLLGCRFSTGACEVTLSDLPASIVVPELGRAGR